MHSKYEYLNLHLPSRMFLRTQGWKTIMISSTNRTNSSRCAHANVIIFCAQMHLDALAVYSLPLYRRAIACGAMLWRPYYARFSCLCALNTDQMRCRIVRRTSVQLMQEANESKVRDERRQLMHAMSRAMSFVRKIENICNSMNLWWEDIKKNAFGCRPRLHIKWQNRWLHFNIPVMKNASQSESRRFIEYLNLTTARSKRAPAWK